MTTFDIEWMECMDELTLAHDMDMISFMESGESGNNESSALYNAITKLKNAIKTLAQKVVSLFRGESSKKTKEEINQILKEHPELKSKKVQIKDYESAMRQNEKDITALKKGKKLSRKGKIAIGVTTVTIGSLVAAAIDDLLIQDKVKSLTYHLNKMESDLKYNKNYTKEIMNDTVNKVKNKDRRSRIYKASEENLEEIDSYMGLLKNQYDMINKYSKEHNPNFILRVLKNLNISDRKKSLNIKDMEDKVSKQNTHTDHLLFTK